MTTIKFEIEAEKKHSVRYKESDSDVPFSRTIYVMKDFLRAEYGDDFPEALNVTVERAA